MGVVTIMLDDAVEAKLRRIAVGKGALGKTLSDAAMKWIDSQEQVQIKKKAFELLKKGYPMGKILYKKRDELYER